MQPLKIEARFARPLNFADFDKKSMRKGFTQVGRDVSKIAKKLVSKKRSICCRSLSGKANRDIPEGNFLQGFALRFLGGREALRKRQAGFCRTEKTRVLSRVCRLWPRRAQTQQANPCAPQTIL